MQGSAGGGSTATAGHGAEQGGQGRLAGALPVREAAEAGAPRHPAERAVPHAPCDPLLPLRLLLSGPPARLVSPRHSAAALGFHVISPGRHLIWASEWPHVPPSSAKPHELPCKLPASAALCGTCNLLGRVHPAVDDGCLLVSWGVAYQAASQARSLPLHLAKPVSSAHGPDCSCASPVSLL